VIVYGSLVRMRFSRRSIGIVNSYLKISRRVIVRLGEALAFSSRRAGNVLA
jgi:hypothetical protein